MYTVHYHEQVVQKDIPKLSAEWREAIRAAIEAKLMTQPELYGQPLRRSLRNYRKLRAGDYRVIFRIQGRIIKILAIQHRSVVYDQIGKRI